jgi:hypothetical protein
MRKRPGTATMVQAHACCTPHGRLRGEPGAVRRLRDQRERLRASGHRAFEARVRPRRSPLPASPRRRVPFRQLARAFEFIRMAKAKMAPFCSRGAGPHWTRGIDACQPTPCAAPCRMRVATHRVPPAACQAAGGGLTMNGALWEASFQSRLRVQRQTTSWLPLCRHAVCAA